MNNLNNFAKRRNKLLREINKSRDYQKYLEKQTQQADKLYYTDKIDYKDYIQQLSQKHKGKTLTQWQQQESKLIKQYDNLKPTTNLLPYIILLVFTLGILALQPAITGFQIFQPEILEIQQNIIQQGDTVTISITPETSVFRDALIYSDNKRIDRIRICDTVRCELPVDALYDNPTLELGTY